MEVLEPRMESKVNDKSLTYGRRAWTRRQHPIQPSGQGFKGTDETGRRSLRWTSKWRIAKRQKKNFFRFSPAANGIPTSKRSRTWQQDYKSRSMLTGGLDRQLDEFPVVNQISEERGRCGDKSDVRLAGLRCRELRK